MWPNAVVMQWNRNHVTRFERDLWIDARIYVQNIVKINKLQYLVPSKPCGFKRTQDSSSLCFNVSEKKYNFQYFTGSCLHDCAYVDHCCMSFKFKIQQL